MYKNINKNNKCPKPNCPIPIKSEPTIPDLNCQCGKALMIYIPPGDHLHPCPIHPDYIVRGPDITW